MGIEIERKFLVSDTSFLKDLKGARCAQGYLAVGPPVAVRVRIMDGTATLNVKTATTAISRTEFEYEIPLEDAEGLLKSSCVGTPIDKTRYFVEHDGMTWEVDVFAGANTGLIVAEIELDNEDQPFSRPVWLGDEVSGDPRYLNTHLSQSPFTTWVT
ncbi:MAG: CYTH domain-containing protein [Candidatus Hydrogenedentes bacterium]|nr:CYTH domain-containing protein [Candidatus Hydrogenedentota bacterium]